MAKKWIVQVEEDKYEFRNGIVEYHSELSSEKGYVVGGGWFHIDHSNRYLLLYSKSHDYGHCSIDEVRRAKQEEYVSPVIEEYEWRFSYSERIDDAMKDYEIV